MESENPNYNLGNTSVPLTLNFIPPVPTESKPTPEMIQKQLEISTKIKQEASQENLNKEEYQHITSFQPNDFPKYEIKTEDAQARFTPNGDQYSQMSNNQHNQVYYPYPNQGPSGYPVPWQMGGGYAYAQDKPDYQLNDLNNPQQHLFQQQFGGYGYPMEAQTGMYPNNMYGYSGYNEEMIKAQYGAQFYTPQATSMPVQENKIPAIKVEEPVHVEPPKMSKAEQLKLILEKRKKKVE